VGQTDRAFARDALTVETAGHGAGLEKTYMVRLRRPECVSAERKTSHVFVATTRRRGPPQTCYLLRKEVDSGQIHTGETTHCPRRVDGVGKATVYRAV
jgi:hypothetical protein